MDNLLKTTVRRVITLMTVSMCAIAAQANSTSTGNNGIEAKQFFANKTIVITGASSGFGKGAALRFAAQGANLVLAARRTELLEKVAHECGTRAIAITTDVSKESEVERLAEEALSKFGRIDVWINDAGVGAIGPFTEIPAADHSRMVDVNLKGTIYGSQCALRQFKKQNGGTLINIASITGKVPIAYYASYSATKFGIVGLDAALRAELRADNVKNIHVCTVLPGVANTPFYLHAANYSGHVANPPGVSPPEPVVDTLLKLARKPKDEVVVGSQTKFLVGMHNLMPRQIESAAAKVMRKAQIEGGKPLAPTSGTLFTPMPAGDAVSDGLK